MNRESLLYPVAVSEALLDVTPHVTRLVDQFAAVDSLAAFGLRHAREGEECLSLSR